MENWLNPSFEQSLVSVIIPCHNQERFLPACLESVVDQDYRPIEVIIVDDGSTDGTSRIMNDFQSAQREGIAVRCFHQTQHGAQHARNEGCRLAQGEFIQFLDGDDVLCRGKLSEQVTVFEAHKEVDVVYGDGQFLIDFGGSASRGRIKSIGPSSDIVESLLSQKWVPPFSYLSRRSAVQRCGPWDVEVKINQDFEYFLRMAIKGSRFWYKAGITGLYRKHSFNTISGQSLLIRARTTQRILAQAEHCLREQGAFTDQRARAMAENYRKIARWAYPEDIGSFNSSLDNLFRLFPQFRPRSRKARLVSAIIGFRNCEKVGELISRRIHKKEKGWF